MALSAERNTPVLGAGGVPVKTFYPVAAATIIYEGALVAVDASGNLVPGAISTTLKAAGIALETIDNSAGAAGDLKCEVVQGAARLINGNSMTKSAVGALCYIVDDATVSSSSNGATRSVAGTVYLVDDNGVWVYVGLSAPVDAAALSAAISAYASTGAAEGASLIGVEDSGSLYTAAQVEAALAEVMKKANAGIAKPVTGPVTLAAATTGAVLMRFVPTYAGSIDKLDAWVTSVVTAAGKSVSFQTYISGTAVTGALMLVSSASCTTLGNRLSGSSATGGNAFTAGQEITIVQSGNITAFTEGELELALFIKSA